MDNVAGLVSEVRARKAKRVLVQLPEGLKTKVIAVVDGLAAAGIEAVVHNDPSYGACDLADKQAKQMDCDLLVHVGHNKFYRDFGVAVPVLYFPWIFDVSLNEIDVSGISEDSVGLVTNIQHIHLLEEVKEKLERSGKTAVIGGQILGCWTANAVKIENQVDAFLFVGSGIFHSLALKTDKPVYGMDVERSKIEKVDLALMEKRRWAHIFNARDAKSFGILVSSKAGQNQLLGGAEKIRKRIESSGRKAVILAMDEIRDDRLMGINVDAFINTACPRILDDTWSKPLVNATDVDRIFEE